MVKFNGKIYLVLVETVKFFNNRFEYFEKTFREYFV